MMKPTLINGVATACLQPDDRGLLYGDGLFETLAVRAGRPLFLERHLSRMGRGAQRLGIAVPASLEQEALDLCAGVERAVLKMILTRGSGNGYATGEGVVPNRILGILPWRDRPGEFGREGVVVRICRARLARNPLLAGIKHLNRLEQVLARAEWAQEYPEGLMRDDRGDLIEGTMTNLFLVIDGSLKTPSLTECGVEGVMRERLLEAARASGMRAEIGRVTIGELDRADELFLTNSLIGIWPVRRVIRDALDLPPMDYHVGTVTRRLQEMMSDE